MNISVIVPIYNEESYIGECIRALLSQDYPVDQYEIIMVDNNSVDRSVEIVKQYSRIKLFYEATKGDYAARNRGIEVARGTIIAFTDSDSAPSSDWLRNIGAAMLDSNVGIIIGSLYFSPGSSSLSMVATYESEKSAYVFSSYTKEIYFGYTCNMVVRKTLFDRLGPFPAIYRNSDVVFVRRVIDLYSCNAVRYSPDIKVQRLEISNLWKYFRKLYMYGRDFQRYGQIASVRPLNNTERFQIFKKTIQKEGYSRAKSVFLFSLLLAGGVCYELGRARSV